jgi:hypothetical protein
MIKWKEHPEMVEFMMEYIPGHMESEIREAFNEKFGIILTEGQIGNFKFVHGIRSHTKGGRFQKGQIPHNKGKKMDLKTYRKVKRTMFRKGNIPQNHREVGSERVDVDGYVMVKISEPNKWILKQRLVYEESTGEKLTKNDVIVFLDGDKQNFDIKNLAKMTRNELVRYNQDHLYGEDFETNRSAVLVAKLKAKIGEAKNGTDRRDNAGD